MLDGWMPTSSSLPTLEAALGRPHATWLRWLKNGTTAGTADLIKHCFRARATGPPVAQLLTSMFAAFELTGAYLKTDMFGFKIVVGGPLLPPPFRCLLLSRAAMLAAFMSTAAESGFADTEAHGCFNLSLMAHATYSRSATSACDVDVLKARRAVPRVALVEAEVPTGKGLVARLVAVRNGILTRLTWLSCDLRQRRLATWAVRNHIWRKRTVSRLLILRVAGFQAGVMTTVELPATGASANERPLEPWVSIGSLVFFDRYLGLPVIEGFQYVIPLVAGHLLRFFAAVACRQDRYLAVAA